MCRKNFSDLVVFSVKRKEKTKKIQDKDWKKKNLQKKY